MRLLAYFTFAFITGLHGFTLFAPYAIFCIVVMRLVHKSRQTRAQQAPHPIPVSAGSLIPNL